MKASSNHFAGKLLYAVVFILIIPTALWFWAKYTEDLIRFPAIHSTFAGALIMAAGLLLLGWAMASLMIYGRGLPMNAYPPENFVSRGPYRLFRHPIYWGFGVFLAGLFIWSGSASGLWLVTPVTILGMIALVAGYEAIDLEARFPGQQIRTILDLPGRQAETPTFRDRVVTLPWVAAPLLISNVITSHLVGDSAPLGAFPPRGWSSAELLLYSGPILILLLPFFLQTKKLLREWALSGIVAIALGLYIALLVPSVGAQHLLPPDLVLFSVPVYLHLLALQLLWLDWTPGKLLPLAVVLLLGGIQVAASHYLPLHLLAGFGVFLLTTYRLRIWALLRSGAELIANSWHEWVFGKVRVINHGFYVGFGTFFGVLVTGILAGKAYAWGILTFTLIGMVFAALWAQFIEGSEKLKRPFGYYGSLVGAIFSGLIVWAMGFDGWVIAGVIAVLMPWVQAIGRLRCLINGCCHGHPVDDERIGIRYFHYRSRVCGLSGLKGELLHPTPLYAIIWLFFLGFILLALWLQHFSGIFILGIYLILAGLGRFVEEAYRGEVQTPFLYGLRLYQWTAVLSIVVGIAFTLVHQAPPDVEPGFAWDTVLAAAIGGVFTLFAMGVDFPYSNARFSRLV